MTRVLLLLAVALAITIQPSTCYIYHLPQLSLNARNADGSLSPHAHVLSEGQMFSLQAAPFGSDQPYIHLSGTVKGTGVGQPSSVLNLVFFSEFNVDLVGYAPSDTQDSQLANRELCCTPSLAARSKCNSIGKAYVRGITAPTPGGPAGDDIPGLYTFSVSQASSSYDATHIVSRAGSQYAVVVLCDASLGAPEPAEVTLVAEFKNPYGYVQGIRYGLLPAYGVLAAFYLLFLVIYMVACCINRSYLIALQFIVACVGLLGLIETGTWFATYFSKNVTGIPSCDADDSCPPPTTDIMIAIVMWVAKGALGRLLLLIVCLGFGVVHARLSKPTTIAVIALGVAYFGFSTIEAMDVALSETLSNSAWAFPVIVCDVAFLVWIYVALDSTRRELAASRQTAKAAMYSQLAKVLAFFVTIWFILAVIIAGIDFGVVPLAWQFSWTLHSFWDVLHLLLLICIAYIWAPGQTTARYALYSQPGTMEDDDGDVELATQRPSFQIDTDSLPSDIDDDLGTGAGLGSGEPFSDDEAAAATGDGSGAVGDKAATAPADDTAGTADDTAAVLSDGSAAEVDTIHVELGSDKAPAAVLTTTDSGDDDDESNPGILQ